MSIEELKTDMERRIIDLPVDVAYYLPTQTDWYYISIDKDGVSEGLVVHKDLIDPDYLNKLAEILVRWWSIERYLRIPD